MKYTEYETWIQELAAKSTKAARRHFAHDSIHRLHDELPFLDEALSGEELALLDELLDHLDDDVASLTESLKLLDRSMCANERRAEEFFPPLTDLVGAIDKWVEYRLTGNTSCIAGIAISVVNAIDYRIGGDNGEYSIEDMDGAPEMHEEFQRQEHFLARR